MSVNREFNIKEANVLFGGERGLFPTFSDVSLVIYDLDGTLYNETRHFLYYAELIRDALPAERRSDYWRELELMWSNRHPLKIGRVYDAERDLVLSVNEQMQVISAWQWAGDKLAPAAVAATYPEPIVCHMEGPLIAVGDGWWMPVVGARRHGLTDTQRYYVRTKEQLHNTAEWLQPISGLADAIRKAGTSVPQVVATNSDLDDAKALLKRLGLTDAVNGLYASCNKPTDAEKWFQRICAEWDVPLHAALSVGDNHLNDVMPALRLGMQGLLIDGGDPSHETTTPSANFQRVSGIEKLIPWLNSLGQES